MHRVEVRDSNFTALQALIEVDPFDYYWHDVDWRYARKNTRIMLAMDGDRCAASLLSWCGHVLHLRGSEAGAHFLLDGMDLRGMEICTSMSLASVLRGWRMADRFRIDLLALPRDEAHLNWTAPVVDLGPEDAARASEILRACDPQWERFTESSVKESLQTNLWLGVKEGDELVAAGSAWFVGDMHNIGLIATDPRFRGKGYATSMVSEFVRRIHEKVPTALIHVKAGNTPAERAYYGVGFKLQRSFMIHKVAV
jgi:ribosomal protein S18 acetylase RimI-like enzyme